ncbi:hypothetical protein Glove_441g83 [Diversispora epigaea]|uniref:Attractin/MKLN-like beta-propeller domain-containing protein n=1 Tax=Diversispora epigaea TaxID=1348612 RepID=A0A397GRU0_9GLOM|nr:hypothetical protein Glove_441g83 [Diversispora epigaea]
MYFSFKFSFCIILLINPILCYDPPPRMHHNSVIIDNRLLIFGGFISFTTSANDFFYLDLSNSFNNANISWNLIVEGSLPINTWLSTSIVSLDNSTIFLIGGYMRNESTLDYDFSKKVYTYDYNNFPSSKWTPPSITGDNIPSRQQIRGVIDNSGVVYIYSGLNTTVLTGEKFLGVMFNDMNIFNTISLTWSNLDISENRPLPTSDYSANILPSGIIVYIGGQEDTGGTNFTLTKMENIKLFDTKKLEWSYMNATGDAIDPRWLFTSVLTPDGYIIIFGGCTHDYTNVSFKFAVLDTNKSPYEWSIPDSSKSNLPPSIYGHSANLYYDYMIIAFGFNMDTQLYSSQVYLYNIKSNTWVKTFNPVEPAITTTFGPSTTNIILPAKKSSKTLAIGLSLGIGGAAIIIIFTATFIIFYKNKKNKTREGILIIAGSSEN